jgi:hypothetical protein
LLLAVVALHGPRQARAVDYHVATSQDLQNALELAAASNETLPVLLILLLLAPSAAVHRPVQSVWHKTCASDLPGQSYPCISQRRVMRIPQVSRFCSCF